MSGPRSACTLLVAAAVACGLAAAPADAVAGNGASGAYGSWFHPGSGITRIALTTKAPYEPQGDARTYQRVPAGFRPVFTENVSRHGARALSDSEEGDALLGLWQDAQTAGALTRTGRGLGPEVQALLAANAKVGYGLLTGSGKRALAQTAQRMEHRLPGLFDTVPGSGRRIAVTTSGQPRAIQSATSFVQGLTAARPDLAAAVEPATTDTDLLYFHKAPINKNYQSYVKSDPRLAAAESAARNQPRTHDEAAAMLERSFTPAFVRSVAAGGHADRFADEIDAAQAVYDLWAVTKDMPDEGHWRMDRYLSRTQASWYGYLDDLASFYEKGPGFAGDDITYKMANVLLDDMFTQLDAQRDGTSELAADLRFTHAEEVLPLAALMQLPGSTRPLPAGTQFSYANDPFRGAQVSPMSANIQWDLFRRGDHYLVRMLYNEKQTAFKTGCTPVRRGSYFYDLDGLEQCFGRTAG